MIDPYDCNEYEITIPQKPTIKRLVAINDILKFSHAIDFFAPDSLAQRFGEFGTLVRSKTVKNLYSLIVDGRYDFEVVVSYIRYYCKDI